MRQVDQLIDAARAGAELRDNRFLQMAADPNRAFAELVLEAPIDLLDVRWFLKASLLGLGGGW